MRSRKFSSASGSPSTYAMFGIETPMGRTPLQGARRLASLHPGLKPLGYSVRPLRGHRQMSKLQGAGEDARALEFGHLQSGRRKRLYLFSALRAN